jgi:hypothetical protein
MTPSKTLYYFAYGSNMSSSRLKARVPSAKSLGVYSLPGFILDFSMHGFDESAKCNARQSSHLNECLHGVLFSMDQQERAILDYHEQLGEGYELIQSQVFSMIDNSPHDCFLYTALRLQEHLLPFDWYHHHVLFGAKEAQLPAAAIKKIQTFDTVSDVDIQRHDEQMSIYADLG